MRTILLVGLLFAIALSAPLDEPVLLEESSDTGREPTATIDDVSNIVDAKETVNTMDGVLPVEDSTKNSTKIDSRAGGLIGGLIGGLAQGLGGIFRGAEHAIGGVLETIQPGIGMQGGMGGLGMGGGMGNYGHHMGGGFGMTEHPIGMMNHYQRPFGYEY